MKNRYVINIIFVLAVIVFSMAILVIFKPKTPGSNIYSPSQNDSCFGVSDELVKRGCEAENNVR